MRELVFALEFRGTAGPVAGHATTRRATSVAPSQTATTIVGVDGVHFRVDPIDGERATLESRVERLGDGSFVEDGTITYGRAGALAFVTVGRGTVAASPRTGWTSGAVMWRVTGGDGIFAGAQGLITSNFTVNASGEVVDYHVARLYLPEGAPMRP